MFMISVFLAALNKKDSFICAIIHKLRTLVKLSWDSGWNSLCLCIPAAQKLCGSWWECGCEEVSSSWLPGRRNFLVLTSQNHKCLLVLLVEGGWRVESTSPQLRSDLRGLCKAQDDLMERIAVTGGLSWLEQQAGRVVVGLVFKSQGI